MDELSWENLDKVFDEAKREQTNQTNKHLNKSAEDE